MGKNGLLQKMNKPVSTGLVLGMLLTPKILSQAEKTTPESSIENKSENTTIINNYYYYPQNTPGVYIDNVYWDPYYFNPQINRIVFRRMQREAWMESSFYLNQLGGFGISFSFQSGIPYYRNNCGPNNNYNNQQFFGQGNIHQNNNQQFFNQGYVPQVKISPRIRNNTGRNHRH